MTVQLSRRALFESAALAALAPSASNVFAATDPKADAEWTGIPSATPATRGVAADGGKRDDPPGGRGDRAGAARSALDGGKRIRTEGRRERETLSLSTP